MTVIDCRCLYNNTGCDCQQRIAENHEKGSCPTAHAPTLQCVVYLTSGCTTRVLPSAVMITQSVLEG